MNTVKLKWYVYIITMIETLYLIFRYGPYKAEKIIKDATNKEIARKQSRLREMGL